MLTEPWGRTSVHLPHLHRIRAGTCPGQLVGGPSSPPCTLALGLCQLQPPGSPRPQTRSQTRPWASTDHVPGSPCPQTRSQHVPAYPRPQTFPHKHDVSSCDFYATGRSDSTHRFSRVSKVTRGKVIITVPFACGQLRPGRFPLPGTASTGAHPAAWPALTFLTA